MDQPENNRDDGINTTVENPGNLSNEELDYEDDISIDDGCTVVEVDSGEVFDEVGDGDDDGKQFTEVVAGPSSDESMTTKTPASGPSLTLGMSEDQIRSNPVIQRMMEEFFKEKFQSLQKTQAGKVDRGNDQHS